MISDNRQHTVLEHTTMTRIVTVPRWLVAFHQKATNGSGAGRKIAQKTVLGDEDDIMPPTHVIRVL